MLIPPSILMIIWAVLTEISIGALFIAGLVPGLLLSSFFIAFCVIGAKLNPSMAPQCTPADFDAVTPAQRRSELISSLSIIGLIAVVIGGIWGGFLTPTEAAGFGAIGALVVGLVKGMRRPELLDAIFRAGKTTAPIMILLITAHMYSRFLAMGGAVTVINGTILSISDSPIIIMLMLFTIWLILGMFIDSTSIILLTVPIFAPIATSIGIDQLAFAIFGILVIEAGLLTPIRDDLSWGHPVLDHDLDGCRPCRGVPSTGKLVAAKSVIGKRYALARCPVLLEAYPRKPGPRDLAGGPCAKHACIPRPMVGPSAG